MTQVKYSASQSAPIDGSRSHFQVLAQSFARAQLVSVAALVDSSTGVIPTVVGMLPIVPAGLSVVGVAASGSNLADVTTSATEMTAVLNALQELATKANAIAAKVGVAAMTYNAGGAAVDGTISTIAATAAGTATGAQATAVAASLAALDEATLVIAKQVNRVCQAVGARKVNTKAMISDASWETPVPAITISPGAAATPGVAKTDMDARIAIMSSNVAILAAALNACVGAFVPGVLVVD